MWSYNYTNELYHHGIKGMKWGHRKKQYISSGVKPGYGKNSKQSISAVNKVKQKRNGLSDKQKKSY